MLQSAIIVLLSSIILKHQFSFKVKQDNYLISTEELKIKFIRKDILLIFLFLILLPTFTIILTSFFNWLSELKFSNDTETIYIIKPDIGSWLVISMIASLGYSVLVIFKTVKIIFKSDEADYWIYYNRKYGFKAAQFIKYLSIIAVIFSTALASLNLHHYVKFKENEIEINKLDSFIENRYDLSQVTQIIHFQKTVAPNGNIVDKPHYAIRFNNNFVWRTTDNLRTPHKNDDKIIEFLISKISLKLIKKDIDK